MANTTASPPTTDSQQVEAPAKRTFTCVACRVYFDTAELQREHFQVEWHRYNLKRKVAGFTPVTLAIFEEKMKSAKASADMASGVGDGARLLCSSCGNKTFASQRALENHQRSKAHVRRSKNNSESHDAQQPEERQARNTTTTAIVVDDEPDSDADSDLELPDYDSNECLFCSAKHDNVEANLEHMSMKHGFYVPDVDACADIDGLVELLGQKSGVGLLCLWCGAAHFSSRLAVQRHMLDKGHCKMARSDEAWSEYEDFYDYSLLDDDSDDDDDAEKDPSAYDLGFELLLPSGSRAGHRDLKHIYRQRLPTDKRPTTSSNSRALVKRVHDRYSGQVLVASGRHGATATHEQAELYWKSQVHRQRRAKKRDLQVGIGQNKLPKHMRDPNHPFY